MDNESYFLTPPVGLLPTFREFLSPLLSKNGSLLISKVHLGKRRHTRTQKHVKVGSRPVPGMARVHIAMCISPSLFYAYLPELSQNWDHRIIPSSNWPF